MPIGLHPGFLLSGSRRQAINPSSDVVVSVGVFSLHIVLVNNAIASLHSLLAWPYLFEASIFTSGGSAT